MKINKEELKEIEDIIKDSDYKNHYQLHTYFEVEHIDNLVRAYKKQKEVIDKINNYIDNYDIFKVFSFPLMKRWEEEQVKSSIEYEFKTSLIKDLKEILEDNEV